ncbi:GGDEF domain-containing protein [Roseibium polysiphoniae]|uniref:diguanylate cyclase n=2 Tax=Roseibium polysiphoniae TaxID=2571221 RepID=A0A944CEK0_9HYPH|nr:GGDEF domain-containing protein [Roseibium polysiphoniae]
MHLMSLDAATLIIAITIVEWVAALLIFLVWRVTPHQTESNRDSIFIWALAFAFAGVGSLSISLRQTFPEDLCIIFGNAFLFLGLGLGPVAVAALWKQKRPYRLAVLPSILWLTLCTIPAFFETYAARALFVQAVFISTSCWIAILCFRHNQERLNTAKWLGITSTLDAVYQTGYMFVSHFKSIGSLTDFYSESATQIYLLLVLLTASAKVILVFSLVIEKEQRHYRDQAHRDSLTGLANRRAFFDDARRWLADQSGWPKPYSVLMIDVDHFKQINDAHGHATGDRILQTLGEICGDGLRLGSIAGRLGGEEFALFLPGTTPHKAIMRAERIRERFARESLAASNGKVSATISGGLYSASSGHEPLERALAAADERLYQAKAKGKNQIVTDILADADIPSKVAPLNAEEAA